MSFYRLHSILTRLAGKPAPAKPATVTAEIAVAGVSRSAPLKDVSMLLDDLKEALAGMADSLASLRTHVVNHPAPVSHLSDDEVAAVTEQVKSMASDIAALHATVAAQGVAVQEAQSTAEEGIQAANEAGDVANSAVDHQETQTLNEESVASQGNNPAAS